MSFRGKVTFVVIGLFVSVTARAETSEPRERQVKFAGAGETPLAGTLLIPDGPPQSRFPALVLLPGSGPTDRDGNQPPALVTDLVKQIADGLASQGVASLRFDKRGMYANAAALPQDLGQWGDFFSWEHFVADAALAYHFLGQQPEIQPGQVGFLGHSEGGLLSLVAAKELAAQSPPPAAIVLVSTAGRSLDAVVDEQLRALLAKQGATEKQTQYYMDENARIVKAIRETAIVPGDVPAGLAALYPTYLGKFLGSNFATDPCRFAAEYPGPVLLVAGASDVQVSLERDAKPLDAALKTRRLDDHRFVTVADASHNLKVVKSKDEAGFAGEIAPGIVETIGKWSVAKLTGPRQKKD